ncbi:MAG: 50S ribosome-binding GTPase [archaeon]|nr:MAG: 50S ribosome-binding GTPase [archaeon]
MASTNQSPHFQKAEQEYILADTKQKKILALKKMISLAPKHKGAENLRKDLKRRLAKLKYVNEKESRKAKSTKNALKKEADATVCILGFTNSGKSSLLAILTNAHPVVTDIPFTTISPEQGVYDYGGCKIQTIEIPAIEKSDLESLSFSRSADLVIFLITSKEELKQAKETLSKFKIKNYLIVQNKLDLFNLNNTKIAVSCKTREGILNLKKEIFENLGLVRIFTKERFKKRAEPMILEKGSTIKDLAKKVHKDFLKDFNYALLWGPSARFQGQRAGLNHVLKDQDMVEIYLKK